MPTPYGTRGGMAFGVEELRVLRRALALALHPGPASAQDVQDCLRLAASLDETTREAARLRAFLVADLARYRAALPGTAAGYLTLLEEVLGAGHPPTADDVTALRALRGNPAAAALLEKVSARVPACRGNARLTALPGGSAGERNRKPGEKPGEQPAPRPEPPKPDRPIPTPGEVFPPRRRPNVPPANPTPPQQRLAAG